MYIICKYKMWFCGLHSQHIFLCSPLLPFAFLLSFLSKFLLECNWFTILHQFPLQNKLNLLCVYIYPHSLRPHFYPSIPPFQLITEDRAELPVFYSRFPLSVSFTGGSICMQSQYPNSSHPPFSFPSVSTSPFSTSVSLFMPCKQVCQIGTIILVSIYMH